MQILITRETSTCVTTPGQLFLVNGNSKRLAPRFTAATRTRTQRSLPHSLR